MKYIYLCKTQDPKYICKSRLKYEGFKGDFYFCGSHRNVNKCWEMK